MSAAPGVNIPIQSRVEGVAIPPHVAVTVVPGVTLAGLTASVAGGAATPVTDLEMPPPPVNETVPENVPTDAGLKRTVIVALAPAARL